MPCLSTCPSCDGSHTDEFLRIQKEGILLFLVQTLSIKKIEANPSLLGTLLWNYPNVGRIVYGGNAKRPRKKSMCDNTVAQLIATGIIVTDIDLERQLNTRSLCRLEFDIVNGIPRQRYEIDSYWDYIDLF